MEINNLKIQLVEYLNLRRKVVDQPNDLQYTDIYTCKHRIMSDESSALYKYSRIENFLLLTPLKYLKLQLVARFNNLLFADLRHDL